MNTKPQLGLALQALVTLVGAVVLTWSVDWRLGVATLLLTLHTNINVEIRKVQDARRWMAHLENIVSAK